MALFDSADEPFRGVQFLLDEDRCLLHLFGLVVFVVGVFIKHLRKVPVDAQFRYSPLVEADIQFPVLVLDDEIGGYLYVADVGGAIPCVARFRVQFDDLGDCPLDLLLLNAEIFDDTVVAFLGKVYE